MGQESKNSFFSGITGISKTSVITLIVILLFAVFVVFKNEAEAPTSIEEGGDEEKLDQQDDEKINDETESVSEDVLMVNDQEAGDSVIISNMTLTENRWVVIHEDIEGEPGNILGARLFFKNDTEGEVELLRETEADNMYYAILYMVAERERDQDRRFDIVRDLPLVKEDDGDMITIPFNTY